MDTYWFNKLLDVLMVQTNSDNEKLMVLYLDKELKKLKLPYCIDAAGNVIVTKGKAKTYPCVTSHMDTVHNFADNFKIYKNTDNEDLLFALDNKKRVGIGGDEKCGIFACLYLLKTIPQIKVVFFSREECGCKGSTGIDKGFFADCRYLIQLDRKGSKDFIQTYWGNKTVSHDFSSEIGLIKKKYKYKNCIGTVTDVMKLWDNKVGISCINLSCGYYKPHTNYEYMSISNLWHSIKFTEEIINTMKSKKYVSLPPVSTVTKVSYATGVYSGRISNYHQCIKCKKWKKEVLLYNVWNKIDHINELICWPCKKELAEKELGGKEIREKGLGTTTRKRKIHNSTDYHTPETIPFACHECGVTSGEMKAGDSLKYIDGKNLYCNDCASLFSIPQKPPKKCWQCEKVIPKDHKVIERFGMPICEDCTTPSDDEIIGVC